MADQQLNIKLNVIDNASKALTQVKNSIFNIRNALIGFGAGAVVKGILDVGSSAQKLKNQFISLAPSVDEGLKAYSALQKFVASSPLDADSIENASSTVFTLTKNSDKLIESLTAIQNASIALNVPLERVSREFNNLSLRGSEATTTLETRGLVGLLGFTDGIKRNGEEAQKAFLKTFGKGASSAVFTNWGAVLETWVGTSSVDSIPDANNKAAGSEGSKSMWSLGSGPGVPSNTSFGNSGFEDSLFIEQGFHSNANYEL